MPTFLIFANRLYLVLIKHRRCFSLTDKLQLSCLLLGLLRLDLLFGHLFHRLHLELLLLLAQFLLEQLTVGALEPHLVQSLLLVGLLKGLNEEGLKAHI